MKINYNVKLDVQVAQLFKTCFTSDKPESADSVSCLVVKQTSVMYNTNRIIKSLLMLPLAIFFYFKHLRLNMRKHAQRRIARDQS